MNYIKLPYSISRSYFYRFVLNAHDKIILQTLFSLILCDKKYYSNGLLIINAKCKTIALTAGESYRTTKRSLTKLSKLGVIIRLNRARYSSKYFLGFRTVDNDRMYLINYHIREYDKWIMRIIDSQLDMNGNDTKMPKLDYSSFILDINLINFVQTNITHIHKLVNHKIKDGHTLYEMLVGKDIARKKPLFKKHLIFSTDGA